MRFSQLAVAMEPTIFSGFHLLGSFFDPEDGGDMFLRNFAVRASYPSSILSDHM
jgi:hypothetical protein